MDPGEGREGEGLCEVWAEVGSLYYIQVISGLGFSEVRWMLMSLKV